MITHILPWEYEDFPLLTPPPFSSPSPSPSLSSLFSLPALPSLPSLCPPFSPHPLHQLVARIPLGMKIPHLRDKLVKIISDYTLQLQLSVGCNNILKDDCATLLNKLYVIKSEKTDMQLYRNCVSFKYPTLYLSYLLTTLRFSSYSPY